MIIIRSHIKFNAKELIKDGEVLYSFEEEDNFTTISKRVNKELRTGYAKFYKMDKLSKLGFLCAEIIFKDFDKSEFREDEIALLFTNHSATLETDSRYQESLKEIASPALFVYTLPNIVLGEISIRHKFRGENLFLIREENITEWLVEQNELLFEQSDTRLCLTGWLELKNEKVFEASLYLIEKREDQGNCLKFIPENIYN